MPYITQTQRDLIDKQINDLLVQLPNANGLVATDDGLAVPASADGIVNYIITRIIDKCYGMGGYSVFNRGMGVMECAKTEFYRRRVMPYENQKAKENGDVYQQ